MFSESGGPPRAKFGHDDGSRLRWTDPKVLSAIVMWMVFAFLLHARFRPAMRGRSVMVLTIVAFAFLVFTWVGVDVLRLATPHGATQDRGKDDYP